MTDTTLEQWLARLETLHPREMELGLERVSSVASTLGLLTPAAPVVTVAGTNGKGSTLAVLEALLLQAGSNVGCFTSPHFQRFNERIRVAGSAVTDGEIVAAFEQIETARGATSLTYFEFSTLAALWVFRDRNVDALLLEIGLGGRLDASNIVDPDVAVITSIDLDHQAWLGDTRGQIAREKAGIMRCGVPVVIVDPDPPEELLARADALGAAPLFRFGAEFGVSGGGAGWQGWVTGSGARRQLPVMPDGPLLPANICAAVQVATLLGRCPPSAELVDTIGNVRLTGRRQVEAVGECRYLLDVAHNPAAVEKLLEHKEITDCNGKVFALFSVMKDKAVSDMIEVAGRHFDGWFLADLPGNARAMPAAEAAALLRRAGRKAVSTGRDVPEAYRQAQRRMAPGDLLVVFGSFFTVAAVLPLLEEDRRRDSPHP